VACHCGGVATCNRHRFFPSLIRDTGSSLTNLGLFVFGNATPPAANFASMALKGAAQGIPVPPGNAGLSGAGLA
jgi:hypothetical protein